ncbi:MAG: hypothetical protein F6J95_007610 [Leptolyngbya sp. SIO1E4]|nr:hypothetical protein [Leptolyngbya sp. SIO1E4]
MVKKKSEYGPGENPRSQENLQPRETLYDEAKRRREVMATQAGWDGFKAVAKELKLSASELVERIGRGFLVFTPPDQSSKDDDHP